MKSTISILVLLLAFTACDKMKGGSNPLKTDDERRSYALGQNIGKSFKEQGIQVNTKHLASSIQEALDGKPSKLNDDEMRQVFMQMRGQMQEKQANTAKANQDLGAKYLEENKKNPNVKVTKSGLQYEVLTEGKGKMPSAKDTVSVHYRGQLIDGTEFDSSYKRNEPAKFPVKGVIPGWTEALQLMKAGSKWKLVIPSSLAYGEQGRPGIPPNSVLVFEVELLSVE